MIEVEESVTILQWYVAYIYSASDLNRFRSHAVAEPIALQPRRGCAYRPILQAVAPRRAEPTALV